MRLGRLGHFHLGMRRIHSQGVVAARTTGQATSAELVEQSGFARIASNFDPHWPSYADFLFHADWDFLADGHRDFFGHGVRHLAVDFHRDHVANRFADLAAHGDGFHGAGGERNLAGAGFRDDFGHAVGDLLGDGVGHHAADNLGHHLDLFFDFGLPTGAGDGLGTGFPFHAGVAGGVGFVPASAFNELPFARLASAFATLYRVTFTRRTLGALADGVATRMTVAIAIAVNPGAFDDAGGGVRNFLDHSFAFVTAGGVGDLLDAFFHVNLGNAYSHLLDGADRDFVTAGVRNFVGDDFLFVAGHWHAFAHGGAAQDLAATNFGDWIRSLSMFATFAAVADLMLAAFAALVADGTFDAIIAWIIADGGTTHDGVGFGNPFHLFAAAHFAGGDRFADGAANGAGSMLDFGFPGGARDFLDALFDFHAGYAVANLTDMVFDDRLADVAHTFAGV